MKITKKENSLEKKGDFITYNESVIIDDPAMLMRKKNRFFLIKNPHNVRLFIRKVIADGKTKKNTD